MIVKMEKITVLAEKKNREAVLKDLRRLGVVHLSGLEKKEAQEADAVWQEISGLNLALQLSKENPNQKTVSGAQAGRLGQEVVSLDKEKKRAEQYRQQLLSQAQNALAWEGFSSQDLKELAAKKVFLQLYLCSRKQLKVIKKNQLVYFVGRQGPQYKVARLSREKDSKLPFLEVLPPEEGFYRLQEKIAGLDKQVKEIEDKIKAYSVYYRSFVGYRNKLLREWEFIKVKSAVGSGEFLFWVQGYCPYDLVAKVRKMAAEKKWGIIIAKPQNKQKVPTLLKNPKWVEIIKPVFNFMGTLPGYREYDISFWFLIFFSLFFAMLVGDAGYGIIFLAATYFMRQKFKKVSPLPFFLAYVLSGATVVWGALSGTWFGSEAIAKLPFFNFLIIERINSFVAGNQNFMIYLSFVVGVIHLSIARLIRAGRFLNSLKALAEIGWLFILWAAFFLAGNLVLNRPFPAFASWLAILGAAAVLLFTDFQKNIIKTIFSGLGALPLETVSSFSDVVSYLRLFAVGYATVAVAAAFNGMAAAALGTFWGALIAAFIIFLGHSLNVALCLMSVIVHGIRLNMLEFSGQLGMEWSGVKYQPFK